MKLLEQSSHNSSPAQASSESAQGTTDDFLILDAGNPIAGDLADAIDHSVFFRFDGVPEHEHALPAVCSRTTVAIVLTRGGSDRLNCPELHYIFEQLAASDIQRVCVVTDCSVHFRPRSAAAYAEITDSFAAGLSGPAKALLSTARHLRTGFVLSPRSSVTKWYRRLSWLAPLLPESLRSSFVTPEELADCLKSLAAAADDTAHSQAITLLGANRSWREVLCECGHGNRLAAWMKPFMTVSRFLGVGMLLWAAMQMAVWFRPGWRRFHFDTITPQSEQELISLCHRHNMPHIEVCGYNNGVRHFGWKHPGKTVVPTVQSGSTLEIEHDHLLVDAGVTLKQCVTALAAADRQFYVVPNYSYIAMGTVFFVPVHGSGSHVSTLGDTVQWVRFLNPDTGEFLEATRDEALFQHSMYNRSSGLILLQMVLKVRQTARYRVQKSVMNHPPADEVWKVFFDPETSNIEARKAHATSQQLMVSKYYADSGDSASGLEAPRDAIGSLWDRLEENRFTAWLFHLLVRKLAYHVELFLREDEFAVFWKHHQSLPVSKIQLRLAKRDGMPHSPFGEADCVSADLFMSRRHRNSFQDFIRTHLPDVRINPGKQSL